MLIEQTAEELYVHRKQCRLTVSYVEKMRKGNVHAAKLKLMLDSKVNNINPIKLTAEVEMEEEQLKALYQKFASPRLYIHRHSPRITILQDLSILLKDTTSTFTQKEISTVDEAVNHGHKYWRNSEMRPCISRAQDIASIKTMSPLTSFTINQFLTEKEKLFRHIFLTELVTHMIINQFGRNKRKHHKYKDGRINYWYEDEYLQAMRSCGHRLSEFRDHSVETFHPPPQECQQSDTDSNLLIGSDEDNKQYKKKKKSEISRVGNKIKRVLKNKYSKKRKEVENFIVISGDKSHINKIRYCLHQMTRETDKTQALINFIQLTFSAYWPRQDLLSENVYSEYSKKRRMNYFLGKFKVKRSVPDCLEEYTRESFFHKILNIGLRVLKKPHELTYLRLPFSHIFWSIKTLYQRYKKALVEERKERNEKKVIKMYRGFQLSEAEIKQIKHNIGAFIQMEGFLSTTLSEERAAQFTLTLFMTINVPVKNLKGLHDNGFANISSCSDTPWEREVLFNAFNMFKIQSLRTKHINSRQVYEITLEYGGIKKVEEKVSKSQKLLESQFLMKMEESRIKCVKHVLNMKEEKMTPKMVQQLREALTKEEKKLQKWKRTLEQQEKKEWTAAYEGLSKWEQQLLDNCTHLQHTMQHIDNYGQLLLAVGDYDRAIAYGRRMVKQGERDRAIEGWQWMKTPCLPHQLSLHRLFLAHCYHNQCRSLQQARQLQAVEELYTCMNISPSHHSYTELIGQLYRAYKPLLRSGYWNKCLEYQQMLTRDVINKKGLYYEITNARDVQREMWRLGMDELEDRIVAQRKKVKQMSLTQGNYTNQSQQQHYILIYMLYQQQWKKYPWTQQKRDYQQVKRQSVAYLHNITPSSHTYTTIKLFTILLQIVDNSKTGRKWLRIVCRHITSFLTSYLYHKRQVYILYECIRQCAKYGEWMSLYQLLLQVAKTQISCPISSQTYDMMMKIYVYMWGASRECMIWVKNTQQQLYQAYQIYLKSCSRQPLENQFVRFPHSIAFWDGKSNFVLDGVFSYQDVIKICLILESYYTTFTSHSHTPRHIQHLQGYLSNILFQRNRAQLEVRVWQQPCEVWDREEEQLEVAKCMAKGDLIMVILYLHHHPNYTREIYTTSHLHLPRQNCTSFNSFIYYPQQTCDTYPAKEVYKKMRRRYEHMQVGRKQQVRNLPTRGANKPQAAVTIKSYAPQSQEWQQLKAPLLLLHMSEGRPYDLLQAKKYCKLSHVLDKRVVCLWDGYQRVFAGRQMQTIGQLHGRTLPLPPVEQLKVERRESLAQLMEQQASSRQKKDNNGF